MTKVNKSSPRGSMESSVQPILTDIAPKVECKDFQKFQDRVEAEISVQLFHCVSKT